jgi:hypothetical protein
MSTTTVDGAQRRGLIPALNGRWHRAALLTLGAVTVAHWAEHVAQSIQIWLLDRPRPEARGILGMAWPWMVTTEWMHWGYALLMLVGLVLLLPGFHGRSRTIWIVALVIQVWHFMEHLFLFIQAQSHHNWWGSTVPTSVLQHFWFPGARPELHLVYNSIVTIPMLIAVAYHMYPTRSERAAHGPTCSCARVGATSTTPLVAA